MIRKNNFKSRRAQITIFIIIAILLVAAIILFFVFARGGIEKIIPIGKGTEPLPYIQKCVEDATLGAVGIMMPQGGYLNPQNYKLYEDKKVGYLCYTLNNYVTCITQQPIYISFLKGEITQYIKPKVETCFASLKKELEKNNYQVSIKNMSLTTELSENLILIKIERELTMTKNKEVKKYKDFDTTIRHPFYNLAIIAQEIASQEAKYCNFEYVGFMLLYPDYEIDKITLGYDVKIYSVADRKTKEKLVFAIRSCAIPPGLG